MRRRILVAAGAAAVVGISGRAAMAQTVAWETLSAPDGSWRIEMPTGTQHRTVTARDGQVRDQYEYTTNIGYALTFAVEPSAGRAEQRPDAAEALLDATVNLAMRPIPGGRVVSNAPIRLGKAIGRSFSVRIDHLQGTLSGRVYVTGRSLLEQMALVRDNQRDNPIIPRFFDSLRLA